jgi:FkbM family methyltransferase
MSFISYAQNFEDVMLWRALKHVERGFYIDVGANDPSLYSVTRAFYERDWRGINIEPVPQYHERLCRDRTDDVNLRIAVGAHAGEMTLHDVPDSGLATTNDALAERYVDEGWTVTDYTVEVRTLADVCAHHATGTIHFLKIDVEGAEKDVLAGMDFGKFRPWIVVIEATEPLSQTVSYDEWEPTMLQADYRFAYFDGLNRFYVTAEKAELLSAFSVPPNVFDDFCLSIDEQAVLRINEAEGRAHQSMRAVQQAEHRAQQLQFVVGQTDARMQQAEAQSRQAESRLRQAEVRVRQAETRTRRAEDRARLAEAGRRQAESRAYQLETRAQQVETRARLVEAHALQIDAHARKLDARSAQAELVERQTRDRIERLEAHIHYLATQLQAVYASRSWKAAAPLRLLGRGARMGRQAASRLSSTPRAVARAALMPLVRIARPVLRRAPLLHKLAAHGMTRFPALRRFLIERDPTRGNAASDAPTTSMNAVDESEHFRAMLLRELQARQHE